MSAQAAAARRVAFATPMTPSLLIGALIVILLVLCAVSLAVGRAPLDVGSAIAQWVRGESTLATLVLIELRVPRTLLAVLVGASLGLAGAALQGLLRNPLAEPGIIGVSSCAAFGAVIAFYSGASFAAPLALPLAGIAGALVAVVLLYALAGREASTLTLILAGVAINGFAAAATALALNLAPESVRGDRNRVLDDGIAGRSQHQPSAACGAVDDRRLGTAVDERPRTRRADAR